MNALAQRRRDRGALGRRKRAPRNWSGWRAAAPEGLPAEMLTPAGAVRTHPP